MYAKHRIGIVLILLSAFMPPVFSADFFDCANAPLHNTRIDCNEILWTAPTTRDIEGSGTSQWYKIEVTTPGKLDVELSKIMGKNFDLYVYETCGNLGAPRCQSKNGMSYDDSCIFDANRGYYYVRVKQVVGSGSYALSFGITCGAEENMPSHDHLNCSGDGNLYWYDQNNFRNDREQDCGEDSCDEWGENFCQYDDVYRARTCYTRGCSNGACFENTYSEPELVEYCASSAGCSNGTCNGQPVYSYDSCYNGDLYSYNGTKRSDLPKQDCGNDSCNLWGDAFCQNGNVFKAGTCFTRGCSNGACFENGYNGLVMDENCSGRGCSNGACLTSVFQLTTCHDNDLYYYENYRILDKSRECGDNSSGSWGGSYCKGGNVGNVYRNRTNYERGCLNDRCFANPRFEERVFQNCSGRGCWNGACAGTVMENASFYCFGPDVYWYNSLNERGKIKENCSSSSLGAWSQDYCGNDGNVYRSRNVSKGGCFIDSCYYQSTRREDEIVENCSGRGCANGNCAIKTELKIINYTDFIEYGFLGSVVWEVSDGIKETGLYVNSPTYIFGISKIRVDPKSKILVENGILSYSYNHYGYNIFPKTTEADSYVIEVWAYEKDVNGKENTTEHVKIMVGRENSNCIIGTRCSETIMPYEIEKINMTSFADFAKDDMKNNSMMYYGPNAGVQSILLPLQYFSTKYYSGIWHCDEINAQKYQIDQRITSYCINNVQSMDPNICKSLRYDREVLDSVYGNRAFLCGALEFVANSCINEEHTGLNTVLCEVNVILWILPLMKGAGAGGGAVASSTAEVTQRVTTISGVEGFKVSETITDLTISETENSAKWTLKTEDVIGNGPLTEVAELGDDGVLRAKYGPNAVKWAATSSDKELASETLNQLKSNGFMNNEIETLVKEDYIGLTKAAYNDDFFKANKLVRYTEIDKRIFRVDNMNPKDIIENGRGFKPKGTSSDYESYVHNNIDSRFIGASKIPEGGFNAAKSTGNVLEGGGSWVYVIDARAGNFVDDLATLPNPGINREIEEAVNAIDKIDSRDIVGAVYMKEGTGEIVDTYVNANYKGTLNLKEIRYDSG